LEKKEDKQHIFCFIKEKNWGKKACGLVVGQLTHRLLCIEPRV
jgi:hypothetical protein